MATRGNIPAGKELMGFYLDKGLARRLRITAAEWGESQSSIVERAVRYILQHGRPIGEVEEEWAGDKGHRRKGGAGPTCGE